MIVKSLIYVCTAIMAFAAAAIAVSYLIVFKRAPENMFDVLCWTTLAHVGAGLLIRPPLLFGSWLSCVVGMMFAAGAFT